VNLNVSQSLTTTNTDMKKSMPPSTSPADNLLQDVHSRMISLPISFRERVCEECAWSVPTFYRKMRSITKPGGTDKIMPSLSNAEKEKIIAVMDEVYQGFWTYCEKYRRKPTVK
jgi:hypothetical protein